jgi:surfeit locus 1 family protein
MTLLTLAGVVLFIVLGRWQWHRAAQSAALQDAFRLGNGPSVSLLASASAALPRYSLIGASGRYDGKHQFLLDNISHAGQPGYEVLTPLQLADGRTLIVNRGWIPLSESRRQLPDVALPTPAGPSADAYAYGRLDNLPVAGISLGHVPPPAVGAWPRLTSFPTMADLSLVLGRPLEPRQLLLDARAPLGYLRDWQPPGMSPAQHLSYAIQWWSFAALALVLYAALNREGRRRTAPLARMRVRAP